MLMTVILSLFLFFVFFSIVMIRYNSELNLMGKGKFQEAFKLYEDKYRKLPDGHKLKPVFQYNLINTLTWSSEHQRALTLWDENAASNMPEALKPSYYFLKILNAVFANQPVASYQSYIAELEKYSTWPEAQLLLSYLADRSGDLERGKQLMDSYFVNPKRKKSVFVDKMLFLFLPTKLLKIQRGFFLGSYYLTRGNTEKAREKFHVLERTPFKNCYSEQAHKTNLV